MCAPFFMQKQGIALTQVSHLYLEIEITPGEAFEVLPPLFWRFRFRKILRDGRFEQRPFDGNPVGAGTCLILGQEQEDEFLPFKEIRFGH
jgi:hypothetical protein